MTGKRLHGGAWVLAVALGACATEPMAEAPAGGGFVDEEGRKWHAVGPVAYEHVTLDRMKLPDRELGIDLGAVSLEEATRLLAPKGEINGIEFRLSDEDAREFARTVQEIVRSKKNLEGGGAGAEPIGATGKTSGVEQRQQAQVLGTDNRSNINSLASTYPYNNHGWMGTTSDPWCTCFKLSNHHTCVTAAHCSHTGSSWITRRPITFQAGSGSPKPQIPAGCYYRVVPGGWNGSNRDYDYSVIALRGRGGAWCSESSYNVGYLGWNTVGFAESGIPTWVSGYPFNDRPPGWGYPTLAYHFRSDTYQPLFSGGQIRYTIDTSGGQSGTAVISNWSDGGYRVRGIHWGASSDYNAGVRMTTDLFNWISSYAGY